MMHLRKSMGLGAALAVALTSAAYTSTKLSDVVDLGKHWYGDELTMKDLEGRVVLFEFWGYN